MEKFIYVFSQRDADSLLALKYTMLIADENKEQFIFLNDGHLSFSDIGDLKFVMSDVLAFQN